jgi:hypothetical protein
MHWQKILLKIEEKFGKERKFTSSDVAWRLGLKKSEASGKLMILYRMKLLKRDRFKRFCLTSKVKLCNKGIAYRYSFSKQGLSYLDWLRNQKPVNDLAIAKIYSDILSHLPEDLKQKLILIGLQGQQKRFKRASGAFFGLHPEAFPVIQYNQMLSENNELKGENARITSLNLFFYDWIKKVAINYLRDVKRIQKEMVGLRVFELLYMVLLPTLQMHSKVDVGTLISLKSELDRILVPQLKKMIDDDFAKKLKALNDEFFTFDDTLKKARPIPGVMMDRINEILSGFIIEDKIDYNSTYTDCLNKIDLTFVKGSEKWKSSPARAGDDSIIIKLLEVTKERDRNKKEKEVWKKRASRYHSDMMMAMKYHKEVHDEMNRKGIEIESKPMFNRLPYILSNRPEDGYYKNQID